MMRLMIAMTALLMMSGCAKKYCEQQQDYSSARESQTLSAPEGLEVPEQDPNLLIPQARGEGSAVVNESRPCLEIPPHMRETG